MANAFFLCDLMIEGKRLVWKNTKSDRFREKEIERYLRGREEEREREKKQQKKKEKREGREERGKDSEIEKRE